MLKLGNLELHQLFSVPVGIVRMPKLDSKTKEKLINNKEVVQRPNSNSPNDTLVLLNDFTQLKNDITDQVNSFVKGCLGYSNALDFKMTNSWVSKQPPGEQVYMHNHANSLISAVYYLTTPPNCGRLIVHRRKHYDNVFSETVEIPVENYTPVAASGWPFEVEEDMLIMFPSNLEHSVEPNSSDTDRYSLASNFFAFGEFGYNKVKQLEIKEWND
jgi:uncharacterized protein (TIGR02466 family)